jgi:hypothetical protein
MFHPSFYTLSPIFGVCLIIWFSHKDEIITKILSTKLFVGIGLISYSLYLWHYPIFAVYRNLDFSINSFDKLFLISLTLILSLISFKYVEQPARNNLNNSYTIFSLIIIFILIALNFNVIMKEGYKNRVVFGLSEIAANLQGKKPKQLTDFDGRECHNSINGCRFNIFSNQKIYLIGDSHMNSLMFDLKERLEKKQIITSTLNGCIYFPGFDQINVKTQIVEKKCNNSYFTKLKSNLLMEKDSINIFAGRFPLYLTNLGFDNMESGIEDGGRAFNLTYASIYRYHNISDSFKKEVLQLSKKNKIILIYPIQEVGWDPNIKIFSNRQYKFSKNINFEYVTTSYEVFKNRTKSSFELLDSIQNNNIYRVFPHTLFCDTKIKNRCITHDKKNIFYSDDDHPSLKGSELINDLIISEIKKINKKMR